MTRASASTLKKTSHCPRWSNRPEPVRLFDFERAPNPRRVRIFIAEKNLDIPKVAVDLFAMEQLSPEFLAINPGGTVPVLETD
ncbi:MAG: glutathione S-transferase N-terminal domain-containing protein, partial [Gammaproteobacteria bacterium]|nr:glutathione S-transferase N-terminal domain-containing protein [Gammaproteobacteria bacterium]